MLRTATTSDSCLPVSCHLSVNRFFIHRPHLPGETHLTAARVAPVFPFVPPNYVDTLALNLAAALSNRALFSSRSASRR